MSVAVQSRPARRLTTKPLGEVFDVVGGGTPPKNNASYFNGNIPWATIRDMRSDVLADTEHTISEEGLRSSSAKLIPAGEVIMASRVGLGKACILQRDTAINQDIRALLPLKPNTVDRRFCLYWLQSVKDDIIAAGTGATVQGIKLPFIKSLPFPDVHFEEQKRIVAVLDQAFAALDRARALAEANLADAETMYRSQLASVFNEKAIETQRLADVCDVRDGTHDTPDYVQDDVPLITQKNVRWDGMHFEKCKNISRTDHNAISKRSRVAQGDILISMIGVNRGECCLVESGTEFSIKNVGLIRKTPEFEMQYLLQYLQSPMAAKYVDYATNGGAQPFIGLGKLRDFPVPKIGIDEQRRVLDDLLAMRSHARRLSSHYLEKLNDFTTLRQCLLQKAFAGELT